MRNCILGMSVMAVASMTLVATAESLEAKAKNDLATRHYHGLGVERDEFKAFSLYREAAKNGYAPAQNNLAWCYANGKGVATNEAEAVKWYRKAAEQGNLAAQYNLARCYISGNGVGKDNKEALRWCCLAAEQGDKDAQTMLHQELGMPVETPKTFMGFEFGRDIRLLDRDAKRTSDGRALYSFGAHWPRFRKFTEKYDRLYGCLQSGKLYKIERSSESFPDDAKQWEKREEFERTCKDIEKRYCVTPIRTKKECFFGLWNEETAKFTVGQVEITLEWVNEYSMKITAVHREYEALAKKEWREDMEKQSGADVL